MTTMFRLTTLGLLLAAAPVLARPALAQDAPRCADCDARDVHERYAAVMTAIAQLQARQDALRFQLAGLSDGDSTEMRLLQRRQRELSGEEQKLRVQMRTLERQMQTPRAVTKKPPRVMRMRTREPEGYLGLNLSGSVETSRDDGVVSFYFTDYPTVESVEPGSPAQRAGLITGDVLLALDGRELKQARIAMSDLLKPDREIAVRVRRSAKVRTMTLTVARRPDRFVLITPEAPTAIVVPPAPPNAVAAAVPVAPRAPAAAGPSFDVIWNGGVSALAGAQLARVTPELGTNYFGVDQGVLVLGVAEGTPAFRAGLKGGDVIVRAGETTVTTPLELQRAFRNADDRRIELRIVRQKKTQTIVLSWQ